MKKTHLSEMIQEGKNILEKVYDIEVGSLEEPEYIYIDDILDLYMGLFLLGEEKKATKLLGDRIDRVSSADQINPSGIIKLTDFARIVGWNTLSLDANRKYIDLVLKDNEGINLEVCGLAQTFREIGGFGVTKVNSLYRGFLQPFANQVFPKYNSSTSFNGTKFLMDYIIGLCRSGWVDEAKPMVEHIRKEYSKKMTTYSKLKSLMAIVAYGEHTGNQDYSSYAFNELASSGIGAGALDLIQIFAHNDMRTVNHEIIKDLEQFYSKQDSSTFKIYLQTYIGEAHFQLGDQLSTNKNIQQVYDMLANRRWNFPDMQWLYCMLSYLRIPEDLRSQARNRIVKDLQLRGNIHQIRRFFGILHRAGDFDTIYRLIPLLREKIKVSKLEIGLLGFELVRFGKRGMSQLECESKLQEDDYAGYIVEHSTCECKMIRTMSDFLVSVGSEMEKLKH